MGLGHRVFYAHSTSDISKKNWQPLVDHLQNVSELAAGFASIFGAENAARLAGLLHDLGKYNSDFQDYIAGKKSSVDHSTAGAAIAIGNSTPTQFDKLVLELLAHAISGHHGGMPDRVVQINGSSGRSLGERLACWQAETLGSDWRQELETTFSDLFPKNFQADQRALKAGAFQLSFLGRMIFSCLVDADFKDTEAFYSNIDGGRIDRNWPSLVDEIPRLRDRFEMYMDGKGKIDTDTNRLRNEILAHIRAQAALATGVFTLNVPTGGGKTLASLGFALDHAKAHEMRRIIYAIPFTSIIDQTAEIFRQVLGDEIVLEHHSAIDEEHVAANESRDKLKLAMEDWAAPVIITTNVQFFESLFANRPSRCRKLHNIAGSIIILDEAQTLPLKFLKPAVLALDELARNYGCSIILCTATQPALDRRDYETKSLMGLEIHGRELAPDPKLLARKLRRARIVQGGVMNDDDICRSIAAEPQSLVIVNSRRHALDLYNIAKGNELDGVIHLTTRQCAAHRKLILDQVRKRLKNGDPCRVIATSLIEAGVDVDFPKIWRAEAGMDQVLQAAGRCNREGARSLDESVVTVFKAADYAPLREQRPFIEAFRRIAANYDLFSPDAIQEYFKEVYWQQDKRLDGEGILDLSMLDGQGTSIAYRTIAERFRMIESGMEPVVIAYDDKAQRSIDMLAVENVPTGKIARELQRYVVLVPPKARTMLVQAGYVSFQAQTLRGDQFAVLDIKSKRYDEECGLIWENPEYLNVENLIL